MTKFFKIASTSLFAVAALGISTAAHAEECSPGFFADLACDMGLMDQGTARGLDQLNAQMGQPFDNGIYAAVDTVLPGAGTAMGAYAQMQQRGVFAGPQMGQPTPPYYPAQPNYQQGFQPNFQPSYQPSYPQMSYVYTCHTPQGSFTFAQPLIAGSQCYSAMPYGTFYGVAGN